MKRVLGLALCATLGLLPAAWGQSSGGSVYGTVADESGAVLPGATVTLESEQFGSRLTTSGTRGEFRFLNMDPGTYTVSVSMTGFAMTRRQVMVNTGVAVKLDFGLKLSSLAESITVTDLQAVVDTKKQGTYTTLTQEELSQVPQGRDPWAVLKTVPGVLVDRVSIAGNEAGQQSVFAGKGASPLDTTYAVDGVVITDSACGGCSSSYYDFDAFDEIKVDTGGNGLQVMTGGVGVNFVTKRGTNSLHGSLRSYFSHNDLFQSSNLPDELAGDSRLGGNDKANHIDQIHDYGAELGGPIVKDKLWFWASWGKNDIRLVNLNQTRDKTLLRNWNAKLNWQASDSDMLSFFFFNGAKSKFGRSPGLAGIEPDSALFDQGSFYAESGCGLPCGLHGLFKVEENHVFSPNFFVNAKYAFYNWGYGFEPRGGTDLNLGTDAVTDEAFGSFVTFTSKRPWHVASVDGSYFKSATGGNHELKFGFGYRRNPVSSTTAFSGNKIWARRNSETDSKALLFRDRIADYIGENWHVYVGDTFSRGRLTVNAGLRWDRQSAANRDSAAPAHVTFPELVPEAKIVADRLPTIEWNDISPRVGINYSLDEQGKTVLRASYARYAGQLDSFGDILPVNGAGAYYPYLAYNWVDLNGDHFAQRNEVLVDEGVQYSNVIDPNDPTNADSVNTIDPNYSSNIDNEVIFGIERELMPNLAVSAAYTWRRGTNFPKWNPRIGLTGANYAINDQATVSTPEGTFSGIAYAPDSALVAASGGGRFLTNRPDYHRGYNGVELSVIKRLSDKWMLRAAFSWMDWQEFYDGSGGVQNPTATDTTNGGFSSGPLVDGGQVTQRSYGAKRDTFFNSKWQVNAAALYELPAGFEVGASLFGRQGYPRMIYLNLSGGSDGSLRVLGTPEVDTLRLESVWNLDLRLSKQVRIAGDVSLGINVDVFNVFNDSVVLQRTRQANSDAFGRINEVINPRVARIGLRLQF